MAIIIPFLISISFCLCLLDRRSNITWGSEIWLGWPVDLAALRSSAARGYKLNVTWSLGQCTYLRADVYRSLLGWERNGWENRVFELTARTYFNRFQSSDLIDFD